MDLSDRMKEYENKTRNYLESGAVIIRIDGSNFSKLTSSLQKPYDDKFIHLMDETALYVCKNTENFRFATVQSDEINICLLPRTEKTQPFYGNNLNKIVSLTAGFASSYFSVHSTKAFPEQKIIQFDSRAFNIPENEIFNYFLYRQKDTIRNALQMAARANFSHKQVVNKSNDQMKEMLKSIGKDFENLPGYFTHGRCIYKIQVEKETPFCETPALRSEFYLDSNMGNFIDKRSFIEDFFIKE